jgi:hypothetical protein
LLQVLALRALPGTAASASFEKNELFVLELFHGYCYAKRAHKPAPATITYNRKPQQQQH